MSKVKKKVLHIAEFSNGEINTVLENYIYSSQNLAVEHYLLARIHKKNDEDVIKEKLFVQSQIIHCNFFSFFLQIYRFIKKVKPQIIHLHASLAGFLGRFLPKGNYKIIYTPHGYNFEKQNISPKMKMFFMWMERFRLNKIDVVAGCSERECALAYNLGAKQTLYLNNYANIKSISLISPIDPPPIHIFIVGHLSDQKDPIFLVKTVKLLNKYSEYKMLKFHWLGGGSYKFTRLLTKHKISVSGMLPRKEILKQLQKAHLYIHTSAWDGMPLTLLEAAKLHIPTLVRFTPALQSVPYPFIALSPKTMAQQIIRFVREPYNPDYLMSLNLFNQNFTQKKQRIALQKLYQI